MQIFIHCSDASLPPHGVFPLNVFAIVTIDMLVFGTVRLVFK